jgi:predicted nucleotidyltransferase
MSLIGSVVRDDFDPEKSDVDVLVEFLPDRIPGWGLFLSNNVGCQGTRLHTRQ